MFIVSSLANDSPANFTIEFRFVPEREISFEPWYVRLLDTFTVSSASWKDTDNAWLVMLKVCEMEHRIHDILKSSKRTVEMTFPKTVNYHAPSLHSCFYLAYNITASESRRHKNRSYGMYKKSISNLNDTNWWIHQLKGFLFSVAIWNEGKPTNAPLAGTVTGFHFWDHNRKMSEKQGNKYGQRTDSLGTRIHSR